MPRRLVSPGHVVHVLNRSVRRERLFHHDPDYEAFEQVLGEALEQVPTRLLAYCVMPNHWHLVMWPYTTELSRFMHWLTLTHARRWHLSRGSLGSGHVYQNRYGAVPVQTECHLLTLLRYVERNALTARLVARAEDWRWCSLWRHCNSCDDLPLTPWPILRPPEWIAFVNEPQRQRELDAIRTAIARQYPIGDPEWAAATAAGIGRSPHRRGRPPNRDRV
jgi:putative transposase